MSKKIKFQIAIATLVFVMVFGTTWQIKGVRKNNAYKVQLSSRVAELQSDYIALSQKNEELQTQLNKYREQAASNDGYAELLKDDLMRTEMIAGIAAVEGPGVIITLKDGILDATANAQYYDANYGIVHDSNILTFINELRGAGAEAISVNDQRIIATSEVRCVGNTVSINGIKLSSPFVIKAIGNSETLDSAMKMHGGAVDQSAFYGINISIKKASTIEIKAFDGTRTFKYAKMIETEGGEAE